MKKHFEFLKKVLLFAGFISLYSCLGHEEQYVCHDYYQIKVNGDSMQLISFTKSIDTGRIQQDTTILIFEEGQFYLDDGSLLLSNKADTLYLRKPVYYLQDEKQVISIKRKEGLNYSTIQTFFVDYGKLSNMTAPIKDEEIQKNTWRLYMSTTFIYDDNYKIVNIIQNGRCFFPSQLSNPSDGYMLKNTDIITCQKGGNEMTIVFHLRQKDSSIKKDRLSLHLERGEYLDEDNKLFLSSKRDTTYISHKNDEKRTLFQMDIGHSNNLNKNKYSIYWDIIYDDNVSFYIPEDIIKEHGISEIIHINESRLFLYDREYNIVGFDYGLLGFFPKYEQR